jgi:thiol:disulfide interchange protein
MALKTVGPYSTTKVPLSTLSDYFKAVSSQKWETDYNTALRKAGQNGNAVLAAFVGLTWCGPCQKLEAEVFQTIKFLEWTFGRVVLLQLDYTLPIDQNSAKKKQLLQQYNVGVYPSILGLDDAGAELGRVVGYSAGSGPANWLASFEGATGL